MNFSNCDWLVLFSNNCLQSAAPKNCQKRENFHYKLSHRTGWCKLFFWYIFAKIRYCFKAEGSLREILSGDFSGGWSVTVIVISGIAGSIRSAGGWSVAVVIVGIVSGNGGFSGGWTVAVIIIGGIAGSLRFSGKRTVAVVVISGVSGSLWSAGGWTVAFVKIVGSEIEWSAQHKNQHGKKFHFCLPICLIVRHFW